SWGLPPDGVAVGWVRNLGILGAAAVDAMGLFAYRSVVAADGLRRHVKKSSNKPDPASPAMALWFAIEDQWRRVAGLERWAR
ncbi:MAG: hypothetical protein ACYDC1_24860, partial [Limisphaerales bacterium]